MNEGKLSMSGRYLQFIRERFPLSSHLPMILSFSFANSSVAANSLASETKVASECAAALVAFLFFLRLRLFDELKDLEYDRVVNPERPLARGLVCPKELFRIIILSIILECLVIMFVAPAAMVAYFIALLFSLLMYKEFFIGSVIRPHLTTYAVLHTLVSILLGYLVAAVSQERSITSFPIHLYVFGAVNWALFNLFEFARKTYARDEERVGVETYSSKFSPRGAGVLSASQILMLLITTASLMGLAFSAKVVIFQIALAGLPLITMLWYLVAGSRKSATSFRAITGLYIVTSYLGFAFGRV